MRSTYGLILAVMTLCGLSSCGEADFGGNNGKSTQSTASSQPEPLATDKASCGDCVEPFPSTTDGKGGQQQKDSVIAEGGENSGGADGGDTATDDDPCNTNKGPGGSRLAYDGSTLEVHGTNASDNMGIGNPPSGRQGAILLIINGESREVFCPGTLAMFGHAGDDNISVTPVSGLTGINVDGGN